MLVNRNRPKGCSQGGLHSFPHGVPGAVFHFLQNHRHGFCSQARVQLRTQLKEENNNLIKKCIRYSSFKKL